ncbi:MAG: N-acetylglucosaminidase [Acetatifactor sp.]
MMKQSFVKKCIVGVLAAAVLITGLPCRTWIVQAAPKTTTQQKLSSRSSENMDEETAEWIDMAGEELAEIAAEREIMAVVYLSDTYPVRSLPSFDSDTTVTVLSGQQVDILDVYVDDDLEIWEYVRLEYNGAEYCGYIPRTYLACSDSRFLEWEEYYGMNRSAALYALDGAGTATYADIEQFPESYRPALLALKEKHPNWIFAKMNTTLDWETVIYNEMQGGKSLVYKTFPDWAKNGLYDSGSWYYATEAAVELYMDPRNALTEDAIFQFEQLTYNAEYHTLEAVERFLQNTFMNSSKNAPKTDMTYAYIFYAVGKSKGREISPFHLAARVLQEQGQGTSPLISGTYPGYEGYYNYFNIGATGKTDKEVIENGLNYAKNAQPYVWNSAYYSILGGADFIGNNYIKKGQDTLYLQKYNVNPNGYYALYTHQYMQNISAPTSEAASIKKLYANAGALDCTFVFKIPVYENMPEKPCGIPTPDTKVTVTVPSGYSGTEIWLDGVQYEGTLNNGRLTVTAPNSSAKTAVMYKYSDAGVPTGMYAWSLRYNGTTYVATAEPELENLLTYHGFSIRITGKSGIRFKTGISTDLRSRLLSSSGVNGYQLKEYGTLVMNNSNSDKYPMVKGGDKVLSGLSYGKDSSGKQQDVVYETVDGRYRFTSVLTGLPVEQYQTEYAFRGYIILEKNGVSYTFYGPAQARSIYNLAQQLLDKGIYQQGTDTYQFLKKIIDDADKISGEAAKSDKTVSGGNAA